MPFKVNSLVSSASAIVLTGMGLSRDNIDISERCEERRRRLRVTHNGCDDLLAREQHEQSEEEGFIRRQPWRHLPKEASNNVDYGCLLSSQMASGAVDDVLSGYEMCVPTSWKIIGELRCTLRSCRAC